MKVINGAEVWGDDGLKIKYDQNHVSYKKGDYATSINAEFVLNPVALLIYVDTLKSWYPPHEKEVITDLQKKQIIESVTKALTLLNVKHEIVSEKKI